MAKLTPKQLSALREVAKMDGKFSAWCIGTSTAEALRRRGLVSNSFGDRPFEKGLDRSNGQVWITPAGLAVLGGEEG